MKQPTIKVPSAGKLANPLKGIGQDVPPGITGFKGFSPQQGSPNEFQLRPYQQLFPLANAMKSKGNSLLPTRDLVGMLLNKNRTGF